MGILLLKLILQSFKPSGKVKLSARKKESATVSNAQTGMSEFELASPAQEGEEEGSQM